MNQPKAKCLLEPKKVFSRFPHHYKPLTQTTATMTKATPTFRSETSFDNEPTTSTPAKAHGSHTQPSESLDLSAISSQQQSPVAPDFSEILGSSSEMNSSPNVDPSAHSTNTPTVEVTSKDKDWNGFKIVGDNVDKTIKPRDMRSDRQTKSVHYFQLYAARDRVNLKESSEAPRPFHPNPPLDELLPTPNDNQTITSNMSVIVARMLTSHMGFFKENLEDVVDMHITHLYSHEMSQKSDVVPLGVLLKNENCYEDMISIMQHIQQYVPTHHSTKEVHIPSEEEPVVMDSVNFHSTIFGGDQLSAKRARGSQMIRSNSKNEADRLEGLIPAAEDWHAKLCLLEVIWKRLYKPSSHREHGTLLQLRNLLRRRNVGTSPKKDFNAHDDYFKLVVTAHVLAAAMELLGMDTLDDDPNPEIIPPDVWMLSDEDRQCILYTLTDLIVSEFVDLSVTFRQEAHQSPDKVHTYACEILSLGLFYMEDSDAIREGDGLRVLRCWRYMLLIFKASGRSNYSIEAFAFLARHAFVLPPRVADQLIWSRFINTHGTPGRNIPCDLHMEHLNRVLKAAVSALGANKTEKAIVRLGKCIATLQEVMQQFDSENMVYKESGSHTSASSAKDLGLILTELSKKVQPFSCARKNPRLFKKS